MAEKTGRRWIQDGGGARTVVRQAGSGFRTVVEPRRRCSQDGGGARTAVEPGRR
jgi:hypothetical protein